MSLEKTQIARPGASVSFGGIGGTTVSPESIDVIMQVNAFPRVSVRYHDQGDTNKARKAVPENLASKLASDQRTMFESATSAQVSVYDGIGGRLGFSGYQVNSSYEIMTGGIGYSAGIVHSSAALDTLQTSIYRFGNTQHRTAADTPAGGTTYSSWISATLERMITDWQDHIENGNLDELSKATAVRAHANNELGLRAFRAVLAASEDENPKLEALGTDYTFKETLSSAIFNMLTGSYGSFLQTVHQFGLQFQTVYIPSASDGYGKYVLTSSLVENPLEKSVNIIRMTLSAGSKSILPVTQVMAQGLPTDSWRPDVVRFSAMPGLSVFPPNVTSGRVYVVSVPSWLPTDTKPLYNQSQQGKLPPDPASYEDKRTLQDKEHREMLDTTVREAIDEWTKNIYVDMALADSVAQLHVPLNFSWEIGKVYKISSEGAKGQGSKNLFTGFLAGISHSLSSLHDAPQAYTSLMFTHVQGEGFTLPGLA